MYLVNFKVIKQIFILWLDALTDLSPEEIRRNSQKEPERTILSNLSSNVGTSLKKRTLLSHSIKGNFYAETTDAFLIPQTDEPNNFPWLEILKLGGVHKLRLQDLAFFDPPPPSVYIFYGINVYKKSIFLTIYPPPLVNVVCERPLT